MVPNKKPPKVKYKRRRIVVPAELIAKPCGVRDQMPVEMMVNQHCNFSVDVEITACFTSLFGRQSVSLVALTRGSALQF